MSVSKLPSGRYRAQVWDAKVGKSVSAAKVLGLTGADATFASKREAVRACEKARLLLGAVKTATTVLEWWERWTTDELFARPKASTNIHNRERTKAFAQSHANVPMSAVNSATVSLWLAGGKRNGQVPALRAMFNDAMSPLGGELVDRNPWAGLGLKKSRGNSDKQPPSEAEVWAIIGHAKRLTFPSFAAWLQVAAFTGMRPGELDALRWDCVDFETERILVRTQWSAGSARFTSPKNGKTRAALLTPPARAALESLAHESEFCFTTRRHTHFTPSSRHSSWNATRAAAGWTDSLYLCTRHFAGAYMTNTLGLSSEIVAIVLGHTDGGQLVRNTYGHRDHDLALRSAARAFREAGTVTPIRRTKEDSA